MYQMRSQKCHLIHDERQKVLIHHKVHDIFSKFIVSDEIDFDQLH